MFLCSGSTDDDDYFIKHPLLLLRKMLFSHYEPFLTENLACFLQDHLPKSAFLSALNAQVKNPSEVTSPDPTAPNKSWSFSGTRTRAPQEADSLSQQPFKPPLLSIGAGSAFAKACYPASIVGFPLNGVLV